MRSIFALLVVCVFALTSLGCGGGTNQVGEGELKTENPRAKRYDEEQTPSGDEQSAAPAGDAASQ